MNNISRIKKTIIWILFLGFLPYFSQGFDISFYKFKINFDTSDRKLNVDLLISLRNTDSIERFLFSDKIIINDFRINDRQIKYKQKNDTLTFNDTPNENLEMHISYTFPVDSFDIKSGIVFLYRMRHWYPAVYDKVFNCEIKIKDLPNYYIITCGEKTEAKGEFTFNANKIETFALFILNKNNFKKESRWNNKLNFYRPKKDTTNRDRFYKKVEESYTFYKDLFHKEPFNREFEIIEMPENSYSGAQSFQNMVYYGKPSIDYFIKYNYNGVSHEVAHQWWGNSLLFNSKITNGFFLIESLTEYLRCIFIEKTQGKDEMKKQLYSYISKIEKYITKDNDIAISDIKGFSSQSANIVLYNKGPLIAYCFSMKIGEEKFLKILAEIYNKNIYTMIDYQTFLSALRENNVDEKTIVYLNDMLNTKGLDNIVKDINSITKE